MVCSKELWLHKRGYRWRIYIGGGGGGTVSLIFPIIYAGHTGLSLVMAVSNNICVHYNILNFSTSYRNSISWTC